jgi:signal transduction histidine kinase
MKIRTRLAYRFTLIVGSILILFAIAVYYFSSTYRQQEFYSRLLEKANNTAKLLIEVDEVSHDLLKIIDKNTASLPREKIVIFNYLNKEMYNTADHDTTRIDPVFLDKVRLAKEIRYKDGDNEALAIVYSGKYDRFVVIASAYDQYGLSKLGNLKLILVTGLLVCVIATMLAGWLYSGQALSPISGVISQVKDITASNLGKRVSEGNGTDEIAQLAVTFNRMLNRIEEAFKIQKSFVSNASHELRTPLTAITGQIEVALMNPRSSAEYESTLQSVLEDIRNLNKLTNGLLELTQANMGIDGIKLSDVRIDELLWQVKNEFSRRNTSYTVNIQISNLPDDESMLSIFASEQLLKTAFTNIIDNACKFSSDQTVNITFTAEKDNILLLFKDYGIGISEMNLQKIYQPFYRADNAKKYTGNGLGLALASKIINLHGGTLDIRSQINTFTEVRIKLPLNS